jgi:NADPH:quinone reductase-like Zn-dependent oxidoreductase
VKAVVHHRYGGPEVLELVELEKPAAEDFGEGHARGKVVVTV